MTRPTWWPGRRRDVASCREVGRSLHRYLDGELDEVTARRLARHLEMCRRCGLEVRTYTEIKRALARSGQETVDADSLGRLQDFAERLMHGPPGQAG